MKPPPRIMATLHEEVTTGVRVTRVALMEPPVAVIPKLDAVFATWWYRAGGYPVGRRFDSRPID